jgi:hypothetical protein
VLVRSVSKKRWYYGALSTALNMELFNFKCKYTAEWDIVHMQSPGRESTFFLKKKKKVLGKGVAVNCNSNLYLQGYYLEAT